MKKTVMIVAAALAVLVLMLAGLSGCALYDLSPETAAPDVTAAPAETPVDTTTEPPAETPDNPAEPARQDGERFEGVIMIEGMEETVHYEHAINSALGFALDYEYESLTRRSEAERELFVSIYDLADSPENYLEISRRAEDAETVCAAIGETLSKDYEISTGTIELSGAGSVLRIDASAAKGGLVTAEKMQSVYIIPAESGCFVAAAHFSFESADGFGTRFGYMMNSFTVLGGQEKLTDEQSLSAVRNYGYSVNPDLKNIVSAGEYPVYWSIASSDDEQVVVLFRSYTGAQTRYTVNKLSGETLVAEFASGETSGDGQPGESFNARSYLISIPGTWQTASMVSDSDGSVQPAYYVCFTASEILYGHKKDGAFVLDYADAISMLEKTSSGGYKLRAESSTGVRYTYQTSESDSTVLEYFETWNEDAFADLYSGSASLSLCS